MPLTSRPPKYPGDQGHPKRKIHKRLKTAAQWTECVFPAHLLKSSAWLRHQEGIFRKGPEKDLSVVPLWVAPGPLKDLRGLSAHFPYLRKHAEPHCVPLTQDLSPQTCRNEHLRLEATHNLGAL